MAAVMATVPDFAAWEADFAKAFAARGAGGSSTHFGYCYAKLGTSVCKDVKCKEKIGKGELRVYKDSHLPFALDGSLSRTYYHPECFFTRVMSRAHKWRFEHFTELENYSSLTGEDFARVVALIAEANMPSDKEVKAKAAAQAKFDKAQARAQAKLEKAEAPPKVTQEDERQKACRRELKAYRAANPAYAKKSLGDIKRMEREAAEKAQSEVDYSEVDAWTLEVAGKIKSRKEKAKAYYEARKAEKQEYQRQYREAHKEELKVKEKERNEGRKADLQTYQDTYREKHADELKAKRKAYNETHKEEVAQYRKAYNEAHKEELAAKRKARYAANRDSILAKAKEAYRLKKVAA